MAPKCKHNRTRKEVRLIGNRVVTVVYCDQTGGCKAVLDTNKRKATAQELRDGSPS